ncbi:hypothetical protein LNN75_11130 [Klebsiella pneumoniae subsp. pneumoniae]|nr:hypothetical protein [Klebsiella pneumoniae subsp. pneumoniae]MCS6059544.1 hypothetical protein [Klebsiella pneumoniae subsp. pneumoniae]
MQDEYGLTLKEGEADMYKHSTNRDVRYAERELHFVIPSTVQGITHLAIFFLILNAKKTLTGLSFPPQTLALRLILPVNIRYQELSYHSISHSQK